MRKILKELYLANGENQNIKCPLIEILFLDEYLDDYFLLITKILELYTYFLVDFLLL
jgi:hypothetical protein